jgi:predicted amidohydrolase YtcJ
MQPPLLDGEGTAWQMLSKTIGAERAARLYPLAELAAQTRLLLGSGWPADMLNPLEVLDRAVNGFRHNTPAAASSPATLKIKPAIDAYTAVAAWGSFDDQRKGSITPGMLADLVVLSDDILAAPGKLSTAAVVATIFDGKVVYRRGGPLTTEPVPSLQH